MSNFDEEQSRYWNSVKNKNRRAPTHHAARLYVLPKLNYLMRQHIFLDKRDRVLDVGAGSGLFSYYLDNISNVTAIDSSKIMLGQNPVDKKIIMNAKKLTFEDNSFDVVFSHAILHHINVKDRLDVINEMKRVSRKYVVFIEPNRNNPLMALFGLIKKEERGLLSFSRSYLNGLVSQSGLEIKNSISFGLITPNRMPIPRLIHNYIGRLFERPFPLGISNIVIANK